MFVYCYFEYLEFVPRGLGGVLVHRVHKRCMRRLPPEAEVVSDEISGRTSTFDGGECKVCGRQIIRRYNIRGPAGGGAGT